MNEISVYRIDYEMKNKDDDVKLWTACIAAYSQKEAIDYLSDFLGRGFKVNQLSRETGLHAITDEIRQKIIDDYLDDEQETKGSKMGVVGEKKPKNVTESTKRGRSITKK